MITAHPLQWPPGWKRAAYTEYSTFKKQTFEQARVGVMHELELLGATNIVISTNLQLRLDGFPYSGQRQPEDKGVCVYFKLGQEDQCIPCDKWHRIEDNMRAIEKTIEALRGLDRWGAKEMVNAAFRGFKALPAGETTGGNRGTNFNQPKAWHETLAVAPDASRDEIREAYRALAQAHHPDQGGNQADFEAVTRAYKEGMSQ